MSYLRVLTLQLVPHLQHADKSMSGRRLEIPRVQFLRKLEEWRGVMGEFMDVKQPFWGR